MLKIIIRHGFPQERGGDCTHSFIKDRHGSILPPPESYGNTFCHTKNCPFLLPFIYLFLSTSVDLVLTSTKCHHVTMLNHNGRRLKEVVLICPRSQHWTVSEPNETKDLSLKSTSFSLHWQLWSWIYSSAEGLVVSTSASRKFKYEYTYRNYMASLERPKGRQEGIESRSPKICELTFVNNNMRNETRVGQMEKRVNWSRLRADIQYFDY